MQRGFGLSHEGSWHARLQSVLSHRPAAYPTLGSVTAEQYASRIRGPINHDAMLQWMGEDEPPYKTWLYVAVLGIRACAWIQEHEGEDWVVILVLEWEGMFPYENPPSAGRIVFEELTQGEVDHLPEKVANDSLRALPYHGLLGVPTWAWIAGGIGAIAMVGLVMSTRRR